MKQYFSFVYLSILSFSLPYNTNTYTLINVREGEAHYKKVQICLGKEYSCCTLQVVAIVKRYKTFMSTSVPNLACVDMKMFLMVL